MQNNEVYYVIDGIRYSQWEYEHVIKWDMERS